MAIFKKLNIGDVVATSGTKVFRKLTTDEPIVGGYLTFSSPSAFTLATANATQNWDGKLEYSTDTNTWREWDGTTISADSGVLYMRGTGNTKITGAAEAIDDVYTERFVINGTNIACNGNIENLLDYATVAIGRHPEMAENCYVGMFQDCTSLTTAPQLPATTLAERCYVWMFRDCTSLTTAPQLPATTLARSCYAGMFYGCTSLTTAPQLPANTLARSCYTNMFCGCTSLTTAPQLPATTLAERCYEWMFYGCTSLTTAPQLPATTLAENCYVNMFDGCTSLTTAPQLPATTLAESCYSGMFYGCTNLMTVPQLPATTLARSCYSEMFRGCTAIKLSQKETGEYKTPYRIPTSGIGQTATTATYLMFSGTGGTFTGAPSINTTYYTSNAVV